jgi:GLPGLI family protein
MRNTLLYFILLTSIVCNAQINSGIINYSVQKNSTDNSDNLSKDVGFKEFAADIDKKTNDLKFKLVFNKSYGLFSLVDNLPIDEEDFMTKMAIKLLRGDNVYYTDLKGKVYFENKEILNEKFSIQTNFDDIKWTITKDKKSIDNYVCYKATYNRPYIDKDSKIKYSEIIAWFCPKLAFNVGPFEAVGLPGLVLEFHSGQYIFYADKIRLNKEEKVIEKPKSGKIITQEKLDEILKQKFSEIQN